MAADDYRALAERFRRGEALTDEERVRLQAYALAHRNYLLAERTATA
jgi:hypothetical protein